MLPTGKNTCRQAKRNRNVTRSLRRYPTCRGFDVFTPKSLDKEKKTLLYGLELQRTLVTGLESQGNWDVA